ncbi:MAG: hypothetical protein L6Q33_04755 [Bacteriovoracaceae bacterium]|nr:hypothetical protein [Bacteriovoracaceae bacterium]
MKISTLKIIFCLVSFLFFGHSWAEEVALSPIVVFKNQKNSHIKWGTLKEKEFLSLSKWIETQDLKDQSPLWENALRERSNQELVGRILHCVNVCKIDKGNSFTRPQFRSSLYEGEEIYTEEKSYLWLFLLDGTLVRLSPESSITIVEFNVSEKEFFIFARVNYGNVLYLSRQSAKVYENNEKETDVTFFPLPIYEAMPESQKITYDEDDLSSFLNEEEKLLKHRRGLNELIEANNQWIKNKSTYTFLVLPTGTIHGRGMQAEVISHFGEDSFVKAKDLGDMEIESEEWSALKVTLRGVDSAETLDLPRGSWYRINARGRELSLLEDDFWPRSGEFITRRIATIMWSRELMLKEYSPAFFADGLTKDEVAQNLGYRLWDPLLETAESSNESDRRLRFLHEYTRRLETSNILVGEKFKEKLESRGEKIDLRKYGDRYFSEALRKYLIYTPALLSDEDRFDKNSTEQILWKKKYGIK